MHDSAILCDLRYVKRKKKHSSSFCPRVRYYFGLWICFISDLSFVILLFEVYLCKKFIKNEMQMARTSCTNSNIVIKYGQNGHVSIRILGCDLFYGNMLTWIFRIKGPRVWAYFIHTHSDFTTDTTDTSALVSLYWFDQCSCHYDSMAGGYNTGTGVVPVPI